MYLSEFKNTLFTVYDKNRNLIKVNSKITAKKTAVFSTSYLNQGQQDQAMKVALDTNFYIEIENQQQNFTSVLFSFRELKNFLSNINAGIVERTGNYNHLPEVPEYYPEIVAVVDVDAVSLWYKKNNETKMLFSLAFVDFSMLMEMLVHCYKNFITINQNTTNLFYLEDKINKANYQIPETMPPASQAAPVTSFQPQVTSEPAQSAAITTEVIEEDPLLSEVEQPVLEQNEIESFSPELSGIEDQVDDTAGFDNPNPWKPK